MREVLAGSRERLLFTSSAGELFERADIAFVCVDTPPSASGDADLSRVESVLEAIPSGTSDAVLVMKSTVPPGTGARLRRALDERGLVGVAYASNPEFLRDGSAIKDFLHPDRVVVGAEEPVVGERVAGLYRAFGGSELITDVTSAEMIKHASNAFLATKISFINEIANVCEEVGADVSVVSHAMGLDERIGTHFLRPGIGYGGSCLAAHELVTVRHRDSVEDVALADLYRQHEGPGDVVHPQGLEVLAWRIGDETPEFLPVSTLTVRDYDGPGVTVHLRDGAAAVTATNDHPFVVFDEVEGTRIVLGGELSEGMRVPRVVSAPLRIDPIPGLG